MFKYVLLAALLLSVGTLSVVGLSARGQLDARRALITQRRAELQALRDFDEEVHTYQRKKNALQTRIDLINKLKLNQTAAAEGIAKVSALDAATIESAAVIDGKRLVVNLSSGARIER